MTETHDPSVAPRLRAVAVSCPDATSGAWRLRPGHPVQRVFQAIRNRSRRSADLLQMLLIDWPIAGVVIASLCDYVTDGLELGDTSVLYPIIEDGLLFYGAYLLHRHGRKATDAARIGAFISRVVSATCARLRVRIIEPATGRAWSIASGEPLSHWREQVTGEVVFEQPDRTYFHDIEDIHEKVYRAITPDQVRQVLRRSNYEKDVVDGRLGAPLGIVGGADPDSGAVDTTDHRP